MTSPLDLMRSQCSSRADAIRWACILEATAPKPGNVSPGFDFDDLAYSDFIEAAEMTSDVFDESDESFSHLVLEASSDVADEIGTNVNLGILLLLGPLVQAEPTQRPYDWASWSTRVRDVLVNLTADDSARLYNAINAAAPGGMGQSEEMDLSGPAPDDFLAAMDVARKQDLIAENYCDGFSQLFEDVVPVVWQSISESGDLLAGIVAAHVKLLSAFPDSLIVRKFGNAVAGDVQQRAAFDSSDPQKLAAFDRFLRDGTVDLSGQHRNINPGTTADLIAAALYILLRVH